jgi:hypothetical protein
MTPSALAEEHVRLLELAQPLSLRLALSLAGSEALRAHGLEPGPATGLVLVAAEGPPLSDTASALAETYRAAGYPVQPQPGTARQAQLSGAPCPIELRKEPLRHPPVLLDAPVPVVALEDAAALAVRSLCDRALPADLLAVHALTSCFREGELLALAAGLDDEFDPRVLADRLEAAAERVGEEPQSWAQSWAQDLRLDLYEPLELADGLHDPYLEPEEPDADASAPVSSPERAESDDL